MKKIGLTVLALVLSAGLMAGCSEKKKAEKAEKEPARTETAEVEKPSGAMKPAATEGPMEMASEAEQKAMEMASEAEVAAETAVKKAEEKVAEKAVAVKKAEEKVAEKAVAVEKAAVEKIEEAAGAVKAVEKPAADKKNVEAGAAIFSAKCLACHGSGGKGTPMAPAFVGNDWIKSSANADIAAVIKDGRSGADKRYKNFAIGMPPNKSMSDADVGALVDYLKSID